MSLAAADKLLKLFEALKNYRDGIPVTDSNPLAKKKEGLLPKKDRLSYITAIPEILCSSAIRSIQEFPKLLAIGVDTLLASCDDDESDVRLVAGEALNKLLKELLDSNLGRLLVELYKEIKKNNAARSLKAALLRFSDIAHLIRPQKCRPFVTNLLPCLGRISARTEESIQEALATAIQKIFPVLGSFTSDTEGKQLMKAFIPNLKSAQATTRRTASSSLAIICQNSRKPSIFHEWLINILLGMVLPLQDVKPSPVYLGVLNCIRLLISHLEDSFSMEEVMKGSFGSQRNFGGDTGGDSKGVSLKQLLQIYEVVMRCTKHTDHNVVNAALETLTQLLRTPPTPLLQVLLSHDGITPTIKPDMQANDDLELPSEVDQDSAIGDIETESSVSTAPTETNLDTESNPDLASTSDFESTKQHDDTTSIGTTGTDLSSVESTDQLCNQITDLRVARDSSSPDLQTSVEDMILESDEDTFNHKTLNLPGPKMGRSLSDPGMVIGEDDTDQSITGPEIDASHLQTEIPDDLPIEEQDRICDDLGELNHDVEPLRTESIITQDVRMLVESSFEIDAVACAGVPMVHIVRVMCSFLLSGRPGEVLPDSNVRVSVKSLSLSCIAQAVRHYPEAFLVGVLPNHDESVGVGQRDVQLVRDILLFNAHPDPQLRGGLASVLCMLMASGLKKGSLDFNSWSRDRCNEYNTAVLNIENLLSLLGCILQDDSPVAIRQACSASKACFASLCESVHCHLVRDLIDILVQLRKKSYWLVKVELLELLEEIDLRLITYLEANKFFKPNEKTEKRLNYQSIQDMLLKDVVFSSLDVDDGRVRHAAAKCCVRLVPKLLLTSGDPRQHAIVQVVSHRVDELAIKQTENRGAQPSSFQAQAKVLHNLSRIVSMTTEILNHSTSKYLTIGCIHLLHSLAQAYPIASYPGAWGCTVAVHCSSPMSPSHFSSGNIPPRPSSPTLCCTGGGGPLSLAVGNVTSSWIAYDLIAHQNLLQLAGQLLFGIASSGISVCIKLQVNQQTEESTSSSEAWNVFSDTAIAPLAEKIIAHLIRLLNVFAHVIDGVTPGAHSFKLSFPGQSKDKPAHPSTPGGASHAPSQSSTSSSSSTSQSQPASAVPKRLLKSKRALSEADLPNTDKSPSKSGGGGEGADGEQKHQSGPPPKSNIGTFHNLPHYMKIYEVVKGTYQNYQVTLSKSLQDKFTNFLRCTLNVLSHFLEISSFPDIGKHVEEILGYLQVCVKVEPCKSFLCVQQLLRAMFGINAVSQPDLTQTPVYPGCLGDTLISLPVSTTTEYFDDGDGLYYDCFEMPQRDYRQSIEKIVQKDEESESSFKRGIGSFFKKIRKRTGSIIRPVVKIDKQSPIHSFIRLFEPLVIRALKEFTISTSVTLHQQALSLLAQLIKLRVNYALLDADQVFITYVQKQFEYVDAGQIKNCDAFLPFVFQFLVLLSYECFQPKFNQAKAIVGMPKVIQLCDGIMASGQAAKTHAIPALQPIVHDLFVLRTSGKSDAAKEVETQREVVLSMLLRFVQYAEVLEMLTMVLNCYQREDEDKWKKMSRQVIDMLLPVLAKQQVCVEKEFGFTALQGTFQAVSPVSLRPADVLLKVLFVPVQLTQLLTLERWLSMVLVLLYTIQGHVSEVQLISRMNEIHIKTNILNGLVDETLDKQYQHPEENQSADEPDKLFGLFLLHVTNITVQRIVSLSNKLNKGSGHDILFLQKQFSRLTLSLTHMFQSENYSRITTSMSALCNSQPPHSLVAEINSSLTKIVPTHPLLVLRWSTVLKSLLFSDVTYWYNLIETGLSPKQETKGTRDFVQPINREATRQAAILLYCDILIEKETDRPGSVLSEVTVLLQSCMEDLIHLHNEIPVVKLFSILHKSSDGSRTLLETFLSGHALQIQKERKDITYTKHLLQCLASVHSSQTCLLLKILAEFFLDCHCRSITRLVESNICKRLEIEISRLKDPKNETSTEELTAVCHLMTSKKQIQRNPRLCSLVHHILASSPRTQSTEMSSTEQLVASMKNYTIDQEWFSRLALQCCSISSPESTALRAKNVHESILLLTALNFSSVCNIMSQEEFDVGLLEDCILVGVERTLQFTSRRLSIEETVIKLYDNTEHFESTGVDHLLLAARLTIFRHMYHVVQDVMTNIPCEAQDEGNTSSRIIIDKDKFPALCKDTQWCTRILDIARGIVSYCSVISSLPRQCVLTVDETCCLCRFIFLPLAIVHHKLVSDVPPNTVELKIALNCIGKVLLLEYGQSVNEVEYVVLVCQAINQVYTLVRAVSLNGTERLIHMTADEDVRPNADREDEFQSITVACDQISDLVSYTYTYLRPGSQSPSVLPQFLYEPFTLAIVGLARRPLVNSYARTPPLVWKMGWMPTPEGPLKTELPPLPIEILKEKDVLNEFVMRVNILGWINRQQFEETWAALLGVLSSPPLPEQVTPEEDMEASHSCCLAVRCISALLLQTTLYPISGNCTAGGYLHSPRHRDLPFLGSRAGKKLSVVRGLVEEEFVNTCCIGAGKAYLTRDDVKQERCASFHRSNSFVSIHGNTAVWTSNKLLFDNPLYGLNVDRILGFHDYTFGQISLLGLHSQAQAQLQEYPDSEDDAAIVVSIPRMAKPEKLDIRSCLQFLLELFEQWMSPYVQPRTPLMLLSEATKALVVFSDLFVDGHHFEWALDTLLELHQNHPSEDDLLNQYSLPVICKALAFLKIEGQSAERVFKILETSLRSPHVPLQMSALYGSLYILESHVPTVVALLIPILTEHLGRKLNSLPSAVMLAQQHLLVMWSTVFYLLEHYSDEIPDSEFKPNILKGAIRIASSNEESTPPAVYYAIMRGLERLVVSFALSSAESDLLVKLSVDRLSMQNPQRSISALGLLITCMYTGKIGDRPSGIYPQPDTTEFPTEDRLLIAMERVTVMFDRIRKGFPSEAQIVAHVLPRLLLDFFPAQEIMNKVIGEFLSSQQPYPELMAEVLFKVFEGLHSQGQQVEVRDWVVLSLASFVQRTPLSMAIWSLTCFFISASTNKWIRALFPHILGRINQLDEIDQKYFCAAAIDFYTNQNLDTPQKQTFLSTFKSVASPDSPYYQLVNTCETQPYLSEMIKIQPQ